MSLPVSAHDKMALLSKASSYMDRFGLANTAEGVIAVLLERGHKLAEARDTAQTIANQGAPIAVFSKAMQDLQTSIINARWAEAALEAQDTLLTLARTSASEPTRLTASMTILDRAGHGAKAEKATGEKRTGKTLDELEAEIQALEKMLKGGTTI